MQNLFSQPVDPAETSRQISVDVEQFVQRVEEQFLQMGRLERTLRFFEKKLRERCSFLSVLLAIMWKGWAESFQLFLFVLSQDAPALVSFSIRSVVACVYNPH